MKKKLFGLLVIVPLLFFLNSCQMNTEETYTVWTDSSSYFDFVLSFNATLNDGMYMRLEFSSADWAKMSDSLTNEGKYVWTKSQIKDWLIGRGFGDSESTKESSWLTTIEHGFIVSRTGNMVYYILK